MLQAMYSAISGMNAFSNSLDVIGNNIANINTTAFKSGTASFKDMLSQTLAGASAPTATAGGTDPTQVGLGVEIGGIVTDETEGSDVSTGRATDLAIDGNGYFALGDGDQTCYTRDGSFSLDAQYNLVSSNGMKVLGWMADPSTGNIDTSAAVSANSGIQIPIGGMSLAEQTSNVTAQGNLDAGAADGAQTSMEFPVFDSLGATHDVTVNFEKTDNAADGSAQWSYSVMCPDVDPNNPVAQGDITFDATGQSTVKSVPVSLTAFASNNGSKQPLDFDIDMSNVSQGSGTSAVSMNNEDGSALGTLSSFNIESSGVIDGSFTNGLTKPLGQLALASVNNPAGLSSVGNNAYTTSANSGSVSLGAPGASGMGTINAGFLEGSNVNLATQFADMIEAQRGFEANSKMITTSDQILQDLVNLRQ